MAKQHKFVRWGGLVAVLCAALALPPAASAQDPSTQELLARLEAVEAEVTELRQENADLKGAVARLLATQPNGAAIPPSPPVTPPAPASAPALAQPSEVAAALAHEPAPRWEGGYIGAGLGLTRLQTSATVSTGAGPVRFFDDEYSTNVHVEIGGRWQRGDLVAGLQFQGVLPTRDFKVEPFSDYSYQLSGSARVMGQVGWANGPFLFYGTAGVQFTKVKLIALQSQTPTVDRIDMTNFVFGIGGEIALSPNLSLSLEWTSMNAHPVNFDRVAVREALLSLRVGL